MINPLHGSRARPYCAPPIANTSERSAPEVLSFETSRRRDVLSFNHHAEVAARIKALQPTASNRAIAKVIGVHSTTIDRAANAALEGKKPKSDQGGGAANAALSGAEAARVVGRRAMPQRDDEKRAGKQAKGARGTGSNQHRKVVRVSEKPTPSLLERGVDKNLADRARPVDGPAGKDRRAREEPTGTGTGKSRGSRGPGF